MAFDSQLGQLLDGTQLNTIAPNATPEQQNVAINEMIGVLNNYSRDIVQSGTVTIVLPAGQSSDVLTVAHNLGYKPKATAYLNGVTIAVNGTVYASVDYPLPTYTGAGADGVGHILFVDYIDFFVDKNNLYIHWNSGVNYGIDHTFPVTYYLERNASN